MSETVQTTRVYRQDTLALYTRQVEAFNRAIQQNEEPTASGHDGQAGSARSLDDVSTLFRT